MPGDEAAVRELAYRLWEARGRRHGDAEQDWLAAERQLAGGVDASDHPSDDRGHELAAGVISSSHLAAEDVPASDTPSSAKRPAAGKAPPAQPKRPPPRRRERTLGNSNSADH